MTTLSLSTPDRRTAPQRRIRLLDAVTITGDSRAVPDACRSDQAPSVAGGVEHSRTRADLDVRA